MGNILTRRRELILADGASDWDVEWDVSKGLPEATGFTKTGSRPETLGELSFYYTANGSSYNNYDWSPVPSIGVMECQVRCQSNARFQMFFYYNGAGISCRLQTSDNYKGLYLGESTATKLKTAAASTTYTIKIVLKGSAGDIYMDDELVAQDQTISYANGDLLRFSGRGTGNTYRQINIYSVKMKLGRI